MYIETKPRLVSNMLIQNKILIYGTTFIANRGYYKASTVFIRMRGPPNKSVAEIVPSSGNEFCTGLYFGKNTLYDSMGCFTYAGAAVKVECPDYNQNTSNDDQIAIPGFNSTI